MHPYVVALTTLFMPGLTIVTEHLAGNGYVVQSATWKEIIHA